MSFLREFFGPSKDEVWQQLARELNADFVAGGFWQGSSKVQVTVRQWTLTLDTFIVSTGKTHVTYTRMRAPYVNPDNFRFKVSRKNFFSEIGKFFGMQDVAIGDAQFDEDFIVQGNDERKLGLLFANPAIRQLIEAQPSISFEVKDDEGWFGATFPAGVDELHFQVVGVIKDIERLKLLYELFAEVLDQLCEIGSAYEKDPEVQLN